MGAPDQFAKATFALDTEDITHGALRWEGPQEVGLTEVRLDGLLSVQAAERLSGLPLPWSAARSLVDVGVEVKMPGDHLDALAIWRAELRRAAWQVRRAEWVFRMLSSASMDPVKRQEILRKLPPIEPTSDPQLLEQREEVARYILQDPRLRDRILKPEVEAAVRREVDAAVRREVDAAARRERENAHGSLRRTLSLRGFTLTAEQDARIAAQSDIETLKRWHDQAVTAPTVDEALA